MDEPDIGTTHYAFHVKKQNKKFWSTTARLLHIDLKKKDVFITYNTNTSNRSDDYTEEKTMSTSVPDRDNPSMRSSNSSDHEFVRTTSDGTTNSATSQATKVVSIPESLSLSANQQVTRASHKDESVAKLVDLFRDPKNPRLQAVLVFKCLKTHEKEHDKLVFKSYLFNSECDLIKCESLIYNHVLGALMADEMINTTNRRVINTRKLANVHIEVHLDGSAARAARQLVKAWKNDGSKDKILQINECDPKRLHLWMTTNAKFIAVSTIKIILMLGCTIHKHERKIRKTNLNDADLKWLATAASRHVFSIWRDRDKINKQCHSKMVVAYDNHQFSANVPKYNLLSQLDKNRLIEETSAVIDQLIKDKFDINIPKQMHQYMF